MKKEMIYDYLKPELVEYSHFGKIAEGASIPIDDPDPWDGMFGGTKFGGTKFGVDGLD